MLNFKKLIFLTLLLLALPLLSSAQQLRDAIGIRVMKNPEYLSPATWYLENVPNPGQPKSTQVDGYEAVIDGRSVYVGASRVDIANLKTEAYIFIMSYNEDGSTAIINIFSQLIDNWNFNSNINSNDICDKVGPDGDVYCASDFDCVVESVDYGPCLSQKGKLRRDVKRVGDLQDLKRELEQYALSNETYPSLAQGTYIPRYSTSKWPSWNQTLSKNLGIELPDDPLNKFYNDCSQFPGYHPDTCWNELVKNFECPSGFIDPTNNLYSYLYVYSAKGICSLHCSNVCENDNSIKCYQDSDCSAVGGICNQNLTCVGGANDTNACKDQDDCPGGICQYDFTCTQNSDCPDTALGEYCMKVNGVIDIQFNLETDKDTTISTNYPLDLASIGASPGAQGICSDSNFWALTPVNFTDIDCCQTLDCTNMGLTGYTCGTYTNNCGKSIDCGACGINEECINGKCCIPDCTGKTCGDDGCGGSCGGCPIGYYCDINYTCVEDCQDTCTPGVDPNRCSSVGQWTQQCANCDLDSCNEWCDDINCGITLNPYCNFDGIVDAVCGKCRNGDTQQCGVDIGACSTGIETCVMGLWGGVCAGGQGSVPEICNGDDDDCDGITDNIPPSGLIPVDPGNDGVCDGFFQKCAGGAWTFNPADIPDYQNPETLCDGLDNDCDGSTDEHQIGPMEACSLGDACGVGVGECGNNGNCVCNPADPNGPAVCSTSIPGTPQPEICDGLDNDCDGTEDNNLTDLFPLNDNQQGVCLGSLKICTSIVGDPTCGPLNLSACWSNDYGSHIPNWEAVEGTCDGLDNDCDGSTDGPGFGNWGLGCYLDINGNGIDDPDECQKGKIRCDLSGEFCHDVYNDPTTMEFTTYGGQPIFDQCCRFVSDGTPYNFSGVSVVYPGTDYSCLFDGCDGWPENGNNNLSYIQGWNSGFFDELTLAGAQGGGGGNIYNYYAYNCDAVCNRRGGMVCVGAGLGLSSLSCVKTLCDAGANCLDVATNIVASGCKGNFHIWQGWSCRDGGIGGHTFPVMSSACYCL